MQFAVGHNDGAPLPIRLVVALVLGGGALGCSGRAAGQSTRSVDVGSTFGGGWEAAATGAQKAELGSTPEGVPVPPPAGLRIVGYYPAWATDDRNFQVADI